MNEIQDLIAAAARPDKTASFITVDADGTERTETFTWAEMLVDATNFGAVLADETGFGHGTKVGIIGSTSRHLVTAIEATWVYGACVSMLPLPFRFNAIDEFIEATKGRISAVDLDVVLLDDLALAFLGDVDLGVETVSITKVADKANGLHAALPTTSVDRSDLSILQFTSGSTSEPKAVAVTYGVLYENLKGVATAIGFAHSDHQFSVMSWLPLYHDMGLVGVLGSAVTRSLSATFAAPQDFIARPHRWMEWVAESRSTITVGPNFAYALAAREMERSEQVLDLSCFKIGLNGAEPVLPSAVRSFVDAGQRHAMSAGAAFPVFGMAEVGIAVSFPPIGRGLAVEHIDPDLFAEQGVAVLVDVTTRPDAKEMVLLGQSIDGIEMKIADVETGDSLPARHVGELCLSGPSVFPGYYRNPDANAQSFRDGWFRTGDLGYLTSDGELVIAGRIKDLIIVSGRNVYPQDIEFAAGSVEGIRTGNVIAFGVHDGTTEHIHVVAESRDNDSGDLRRKVKQAVSHYCDTTPHKVLIVGPGTVPKTSSGKLQRAACKQMFLQGDLVKSI